MATPEDPMRAKSDSEGEALGDFAPGELDALIEEGEKSGPPLDGEQVLAELRALRRSQES